MRRLDGERVLLIAPRFFGYEEEIASELRRRGADIDFLPDRPFQSSLLKAVTRFKRELVLGYANRFFIDSIEKLGRTSYKYILVIQGEGVSPQLLTILRTNFPSALFVLYMWDSFRNKKSLIPNLDYFDRCLTFDPDDAQQYGMVFRPLFFSPGFSRAPMQNFDYGLSFIGTAHSDRYKIVSQVTSGLSELERCYVYLYLQAPWVYWAHKIGNRAFRGARAEDFKYSPLSKAEVQRVFFSSMAVIDIEHPAQTGLTMRTFETIGSNKKMITTNQRVRDYDFYNDENIFVLDRKNIRRVPKSFFKKPYTPVKESIYSKYSLSGWIEEILFHRIKE